MTLSRLAPVLFVASVIACRSKEAPPPVEQKEPAVTDAKNPAISGQAPETKTPEAKEPGLPPANPEAPPGSLALVGPPLWITPGKGIGAIFFGAYEETVTERMEAPCDLTKDETTSKNPHKIKRCAYVGRGIELAFEDGVLSKIHVHRRDREVRGFDLKETRYYGTFKGGIAPQTMLGLHKHIVEEEYGKPKSEEQLKEQGPDGLIALARYPGVTFEYDHLKNGNTVLAGFIIEPDEKSKKNIKKAQEELEKKPG